MPSPLRLAIRAGYAFTLLRNRSRIRPTDVPAVRSGDRTADRLLLVGNGASHGWGVLTHRLALTGRLAEAVAEYTHRPCDVDLIGAESMDVRSTLDWIGDRDLAAFDSVVIMIGTSDALRFTPARVWEAEMADVLDELATELRDGAVMTVAGIPGIASSGVYRGPIARLADRHRRRLNAITQRLAADRRLPYLDLPAAAVGPPVATYRRFADRLAFAVAPRLLAGRPVAHERPLLAARDWQWGGTEQLVELARSGGDDDLRRLATIAQRSYGVEIAVVSLVDGDRLFYANNTDVMPSSVPFDLSFCKYTVEAGEPIVIGDTGRDPRFAGNPLVDVSFINFYAGYPLRSSDGEVIGSFCLQGSRARRQESVAQDLLRQLALEAQEVLRAYENGEAPSARVVTTLSRLPAPTGTSVDVEDLEVR